MDSTTVTKQIKLQYWADIFRERQASGLTIAKWCKENDVTPSNYYYWLKRIKQMACDSLPIVDVQSNQLVKVPASLTETKKVPLENNGKYVLRITSGEMTFEFTNDATPEFMKKALTVLTYVG